MVEERNTKRKDEMKQLLERLQERTRKVREVQTSSLKSTSGYEARSGCEWPGTTSPGSAVPRLLDGEPAVMTKLVGNESTSGYEARSGCEWPGTTSPGSAVPRLLDGEPAVMTNLVGNEHSFQERRKRYSIFTDRISRIPPKMHRSHGIDIMQDDDEVYFYKTDSTIDNESTSGCETGSETGSELGSEGTISPASPSEFKRNAPVLIKYPSTGHEIRRRPRKMGPPVEKMREEVSLYKSYSTIDNEIRRRPRKMGPPVEKMREEVSLYKPYSTIDNEDQSQLETQNRLIQWNVDSTKRGTGVFQAIPYVHQDYQRTSYQKDCDSSQSWFYLVAKMNTLKQKNGELENIIKKQNKLLEGNERRTLGKKGKFSEPTLSSKLDASHRHDSDPYWFNDIGPAVSESIYSEVGTSNSEMDDCISGLSSGNLDQICHELKVAVTVSSKGTQMLIPDTGVELYVPGGSLLCRQLIEIKIIDFDNDKFDALFRLDRNSSVAVQLLPNKATLRLPARLRLPHCLRLKPNFQELQSHVRIYCSKNAPGQDVQWEHDPELKYELKEDCCIIYVTKFCSLRYDVIDEAIDATKVTVFTSGKQHGTSTELAVGYHVDLPGRREMLLTMNDDMKILKAKPFEFMKGSTDTLQVYLTSAVSRAHNVEKRTTEVVGKLSVSEAASKIAELPLDRPKSLHSSDASDLGVNHHILTAILKVAETVSNKGTTMRILDTGIELTIPPNALKGYQYIEMSVIPFGTLNEPIATFSSNSSMIVELLPNKTTFSTPVRLSLPHCLKLKKGFSKDSVKVYLSHHEKDQKPFWEELPDAMYELKADHCVIYLTSFCWVKYEIDNKIVVAKRIRVYTATRGMEQHDHIAEVEVGYFLDMPGRAENLRANTDLKISQCKPLLFFKEGNRPLHIFLMKVLPMFWKYSTPDRNPKVIPYNSIADSVDTSLPFVFEKQDASELKPFAMFMVSQGNEEVEINIRL